MITLSKSGSTVTFTFDENSGYLQNGTIDVPVNSLSLITDESDMATFRKSASNDIFISARYEEFGMSKAELEAWYKANMTSSGGGGGGGVTPEEVQTMIDSSISGKADTSAVTESISAATDDMATQTWVGEQGYLTEHQSLSAYSTTEEVNSAITEATSGKASQSDLETISGQVANKQDTLVSGTNIKTINNESLLGSGNIDIQGGGGKAIEAGRGISITTGATADTVSFDLPISADTDGSVNEILVGNNNTIGSDTNKNIVIGDNNTTFGQGSARHYSGATIIGYNNNVGCTGTQNDRNDWSFVIGRRNKVGGGNTYILGVDNNFYDADYYGRKKNYSYVIGRGNTSSLSTDGNNIFVFGAYNKITKSDEFALGEYNASSNDGTTSGNTFFSIGNGTADNARHNAFEIRQNGDIYCNNGTSDVKLQDYIQFKIVQITQAAYDALVTKDSSTIYIIVN